jgi:hypothetical protein
VSKGRTAPRKIGFPTGIFIKKKKKETLSTIQLSAIPTPLFFIHIVF